MPMTLSSRGKCSFPGRQHGRVPGVTISFDDTTKKESSRNRERIQITDVVLLLSPQPLNRVSKPILLLKSKGRIGTGRSVSKKAEQGHLV